MSLSILEVADEVTLPCTGMTGEFYPVPSRPRRPEAGPRKNKIKETVDTRMRAAAKALCNTCPQQNPCLELAVANGEEHGVWGGIDFGHTEEREAFLRAHRRRRRN